MSTGHYGPLVVAWSGLFPRPGDTVILPRKDQEEGTCVTRARVLREATYEEYKTCCEDRGIPATAAKRRYFELQAD